jgi:transposase
MEFDPSLKPLSQDLRDRVIAALEAGDATQQQIAQRFRVSLSWVKKIWTRYGATGSAAARPNGGGPTPKLTTQHKALLADLVKEQPDATLAELKERTGAPVSQGWLCRVLQQLGLPRKKKACAPPSKSVRTWSKRAKPGGPSIRKPQ